MSDHTRRPAPGDEDSIREAVRSVRPPSASEKFRVRLRQEFASGTVSEPLPAPARPGWHLAWVAGLAAAALIAAFVGTNRGPGWRVTAIGEGGRVRVNGDWVTSRDPGALSARLHPGCRLETAESSTLELEGTGFMVFQLTPGTEITLPPTPARWLGRSVSGGLIRGELRVATEAGFHGAHLTLRTAEASVQVIGTTLSVICKPDTTCVCVFEGLVQVGAGAAAGQAIPAGKRRFLYSGGGASELFDLTDMERAKLGMLRSAVSRP